MKHASAALSIIIVCMLSACTGGQTTSKLTAGPTVTTAMVQETKSGEEAGWRSVANLSSSQCGTTIGPPARERAVSQSDCVTGLVESHVIPRAAFPDLVRDSRADARRIATLYAQGSISPARYAEMSQGRLRRYQQQWMVKAAEVTVTPEMTKVVKLNKSTQSINTLAAADLPE